MSSDPETMTSKYRYLLIVISSKSFEPGLDLLEMGPTPQQCQFRVAGFESSSLLSYKPEIVKTWMAHKSFFVEHPYLFPFITHSLNFSPERATKTKKGGWEVVEGEAMDTAR